MDTGWQMSPIVEVTDYGAFMYVLKLQAFAKIGYYSVTAN